MSAWKFGNEEEQRLKEMLDIAAPTSYEVLMGNYLRETWRALRLDVSTDVLGNVYSSLPGTVPIHIGLVAHMDTITIQISKVMPNGMLLFRSINLSPYVLLGQRVDIVSQKGFIPGVIGFDPTSQYGQPKGLTEEDLWIDIGTNSAQNSLSRIEIGDFAILQRQYTRIGESCICGTGIDDRIGLFILSECMSWFAIHRLPLYLHAISSVQEEIGLRGASAIIHNQHLDACFVVDVDYATDTLIPHENQLGELYLGKGAGMNRKADNNIVLQRLVRKVADKQGLPYQISLGRHIYGGTDATAIQLQMGGIATMNINIPCRYMHSAVEICNIQDVENVINLLIATIEHIAESNKKSFIPGID